jgi:hypothetical protein
MSDSRRDMTHGRMKYAFSAEILKEGYYLQDLDVEETTVLKVAVK